jgi:hypothetical protein
VSGRFVKCVIAFRLEQELAQQQLIKADLARRIGKAPPPDKPDTNKSSAD